MGPSGLQPNALPLSYTAIITIHIAISVGFCWGSRYNMFGQSFPTIPSLVMQNFPELVRGL